MRIHFQRLQHFTLPNADSGDKAIRVSDKSHHIVKSVENNGRSVLDLPVGLPQVDVVSLNYSFLTVDSPQAYVLIPKRKQPLFKLFARNQNSSKYIVVADLSEYNTVFADYVNNFSFELIQAHQNQSHTLIDQHLSDLSQLSQEIAERLSSNSIPNANAAIRVGSQHSYIVWIAWVD